MSKREQEGEVEGWDLQYLLVGILCFVSEVVVVVFVAADFYY